MKKLSILICSVYERSGMLSRLLGEMTRQIEENDAKDDVEILTEIDNYGDRRIGVKRNVLLERAKGEYLCFYDDDDWISHDYIKLILSAIKTKPDCCSLTGEITFDGERPKPFIHSIDHDRYWEDEQAYYRYPNHLNTIKSSIAKQFKFPEINHGEDSDFAYQIHNSGLLKKEFKIEPVIYFYNYITNKPKP